MNKLLFTLGLISTLYVIFPRTAMASYGNCETMYGGYGTTTCVSGSLSVNKTVKNPTNGSFVDNLGMNDPKFTPGQEIDFQITVTNNGSAAINNVTLRDVFPQYISFVSGDGSFDKTNSVDTITVGTLAAGKSQTYSIKAQAASASALPSNAGIVCVVNQSVANADNQPQAQDNAQLCIQNNVLGAQTKGGLTIFPATVSPKTPATGPEALALLALLPTAFAGLTLRKKAFNK